MIKEIKNVEAIRNALEQFTPYLYTLSSGNVDKTVLAEKYCRYAKVIGLYEEDVLVGFGCFYCNDTDTQTAYLSLIAIMPECQRKGYGQVLLSEIIGISAAAGMERIQLEVRKNNLKGIRFYQKFGFSLLEKETEDSLFMEFVF